MKAHSTTVWREKSESVSVCLMSDVHFGSSTCDVGAWQADLRKAKAQGSLIYILGDIFDAVVPTDSKRFRSGANDTEYRVDSMLDAVIDDCADILHSVRRQVVLCLRGNHEDNIIQRCHTDMVRRLCERISDEEHTVHYGGIGCSHVLRIVDGGGKYCLCRMALHHGAGGSAPVSKGVMQFSRVKLDGYDIVAHGHTHNLTVTPDVRQSIAAGGTVTHRKRYDISTGGYLNQGLGESYATRKNLPQTPVGCAWVTVCCKRDEDGARYPSMEVTI